MAMLRILAFCSLIVLSLSLKIRETISVDNSLTDLEWPNWSICPENEQWSFCYAHCQKNCTNYDKPIACPLMCIPGCVCKEGFVRGPTGQCISPEQCSVQSEASEKLENSNELEWSICGQDERWSMCSAHCQKNCLNYNEPLVCPFMCVPGCICKPGMVRGPNGQCIKRTECSVSIQENKLDPSKQSVCREGERWDICNAHCQKNCTNFDKPIICPKICLPGCICEEGLVRGADGRCIPSTECPVSIRTHQSGDSKQSVCQERERWDFCNAHCQKNCTNFDKPIICPKICYPGCVCEEGLVRGADGKCVLTTECPVSIRTQQSGDLDYPELEQQELRSDDTLRAEWSICNSGERWSMCNAHCQKNCTNYDKPLVCPLWCVPGCICEEGLVRGLNGLCIPPSQCSATVHELEQQKGFTPVCRDSEHWDRCLAHCQKNCTNYNELIPCHKLCMPGCVCDEGFVRGPQGKCIPTDKCDEKNEYEESVCRVDERWDTCYAHCQKNCTNYNKPIPCPKICVPGCVCKEGLIRGPHGECIKPTKCSVSVREESAWRKCWENEHWDRCGARCQRRCVDGDGPLICPTVCAPGCVCDNGFVRNSKGKCIRRSQCSVDQHVDKESQKCPALEHFDECNAFCQRNCSTIEGPLPCPTICAPGCVCISGLVRGPDGKCIHPRSCPTSIERISSKGEKPYCLENEEYTKCNGDEFCQKSCSRNSVPYSCSFLCTEGCTCKEGLVRNRYGKCIHPSQCTIVREQETVQDQFPIPIICRRDEVFSACVSSCPDDCDNYKDPNRRCNRLCLPGCTCKKGTIRGPDGKCIKTDQCPTDVRPEDCTDFEYYDACGTSCPANCTNYNIPDRQCDKRCVIGCFCQPGYVRGPKGDCIYPFDCPNTSNSVISNYEETDLTELLFEINSNDGSL